MSDTPRTDDQTFDIECIRGDAHLGRHVYPCGSGDYVESNFSRQLERELNAANERIKRLEEESESRWNLAQSAIGSCAEMSSHIKQLEEAGDEVVWFFCPKDESQYSTKQLAALNRWNAATKETKP